MKADFDDMNSIQQKISSAGLEVLKDIDANPLNVCAAGVVKSTTAMFGVLIRLEPNNNSKQYRLTIRTNNVSLSSTLIRLISEQL